MKLILVRYGEIGLKGGNRSLFEKQLVKNMKKVLPENTDVVRKRGRILVHLEEEVPQLTKVFGISSISYAEDCAQTMDDIKDAVMRKVEKKDSFRITASRLSKNTSFTSEDLQKEVGAHVVEQTNMKVNLKQPGIELFIEILDDRAYVFTEKISGPGGLPVGIEGTVLACITDSLASRVAAWYMLKRGCDIVPISTNKQTLEWLSAFMPAPKEPRVTQDIDQVAQEHNAKALCVDDQLDTLRTYPTSLTILRPVVAFSEDEIEQLRINQTKS